jgi:hypothetical protein
MKMFALVATEESRWGSSATEYYHSLEEASAARSKRPYFSRGENNEEVIHPGEEWLRIVEVDRPSQPCLTCGGESENKPEQYAKYPYCRHCHYVGNAAADMRSEQLEYMYERFAGTDLEVQVWHTGGGCFGLAITRPGWVYFATDGEASLPEKDGVPIRDDWGYLGAHTQQQWDESDWENHVELFACDWDKEWDDRGTLTDEELCDRVLAHRKEVVRTEQLWRQDAKA